MNLYIQDHRVDEEGLPLADLPFSETQLFIHTRRPHTGREVQLLSRNVP
jgi:hypothetical protein